jgi:Fic family protein
MAAKKIHSNKDSGGNSVHLIPCRPLLAALRAEQSAKTSGGIYHKLQIDLTYNSNHIEGSQLSREQTRYIFETNTIALEGKTINVDDIVETANHFKCIDMIISQAKRVLSEKFIKRLHLTLKNGSSDARSDWFAVGDYKRLPNEVDGKATTAPEEVAAAMREQLADYNAVKKKTLAEIIEFHVRFESIHPFQDGNGRVGRLIMFKECLRNGIVPFIITEELKMFYYRGLNQWQSQRGYLTDTCLAAQDQFKQILDYFRITYS